MEDEENLHGGSESAPKEEEGEAAEKEVEKREKGEAVEKEVQKVEEKEESEEKLPVPDNIEGLETMPVKEEVQEEPEREEQVEEEVDNGEVLYSGNEEDEKDYYYKRAPIKVHLDFKEEERDDVARIPARPRSTDWLDVRSNNSWFTEPAHLNLDGTRKSDEMNFSRKPMTNNLEKTYNDYLKKYRPWVYTGRPAWSYYYRPWLYYPFNRKYYDKYYDKYRFYDPYYDIYYDDYLDYLGRYKHLYNDSSAVEDYLRSLEKMDNIRDSIDSLRRDLELSELRDDLNQTRRKLRNDLELSRSYRLAAEDLDDIESRALDAQVWSEAAPRPRLTASATPYRDHLNTLRLRSLRLEEKRLLEIRRLQELERLRGPQPKWYELKTPQFHKEARKNNELLAAKQQWSDLRDYTESVWRSRDLSRSATDL